MAQVSSKDKISNSNKLLVKCHICQKYVDSRDTALCSICKHSFEFDCEGYPEKVYRMMKPTIRSKWKCKKCRSHTSFSEPNSDISKKESTRIYDISNSTILSENMEYVTARKKYHINVTTENSFASLPENDEGTSLSATLLNRSCPILNTNVYQELEEYKLKLTEMQEQLQITENELEELLSENVKLKKELQTYRRKNASLIKFGNSPTPSHKHKKINKMLNSTPNASPAKDQLIASLKNKISCLETELEKTVIEMNSLRHYIKLIDVKELCLPPKNVPLSSIKSTLTGNLEYLHVCKPNEEQRREEMVTMVPLSYTPSPKSKVCVLSCDNKNNILSHLESKFHNYSFCHYCKPGSGIEKLLLNID